jgi:superfamily II DNA helicase RecQ
VVFKSSFQVCAVELSAQRKNDLLIVLGTGGGKSVVFMLCAMNKDEDRLTTIVILLLVALAQDLVCHLRGMKVHIAMWLNTTSYYSAQVTIAVSKTATSKAFQSYFRKGYQDKKIRCVVVNEIHTILTDIHYRPLLSHIKDLMQGGVQFIGLFATILPAAVTKIMALMHLLLGNTLLILCPLYNTSQLECHHKCLPFLYIM